MVSGLSPGASPKTAPASLARWTCSFTSKVPAPNKTSGNLAAIRLIDSSAAAVRKVISMMSSPPSSRASAKGSADSTRSRTTTGTMRLARMRSITGIRKSVNDDSKFPNSLIMRWSGWRDSNPRPPAPQAGALPDCATARFVNGRRRKQGKCGLASTENHDIPPPHESHQDRHRRSQRLHRDGIAPPAARPSGRGTRGRHLARRRRANRWARCFRDFARHRVRS